MPKQIIKAKKKYKIADDPEFAMKEKEIKEKIIKAWAVVDKRKRIQREAIGQLEIYEKKKQATTNKWDTYPVEIIIPITIKLKK